MGPGLRRRSWRCSNGQECKRSSTSAATQDHDAIRSTTAARSSWRWPSAGSSTATPKRSVDASAASLERPLRLHSPAGVPQLRRPDGHGRMAGGARLGPRGACTLRHVRRDAVDEVSPALHRRPARRARPRGAAPVTRRRRASSFSPRRPRCGTAASISAASSSPEHSRERERPADVLPHLAVVLALDRRLLARVPADEEARDVATEDIRRRERRVGQAVHAQRADLRRLVGTGSAKRPRGSDSPSVVKRARPARAWSGERLRLKLAASGRSAPSRIEPVQPGPVN